MTTYESHIGIDVSKASLEVSPFDKGQPSVPNTLAGIRVLLGRLQKKNDSFMICCEATGGYERLLVEACHASDIPIAVVNARQVRDFAKSKGILAKTDAIDAKVLADYATQNPPRLTPKLECWRKKAKAIHVRLDEVKRMLTQERNRLDTLGDPMVIGMIKRHIRNLEGQVSALNTQLAKLVKTEAAFRDLCDRLMAVKGIGIITATALIAFLPEIGRVGDSQLVALAGLAPFCQDSGTWKGQRHISGGRSLLRSTLYMPAISASRTNPILKDFYDGLIKRGKPAKVALTAVMRKMVCLANRMASDPTFSPV